MSNIRLSFTVLLIAAFRICPLAESAEPDQVRVSIDMDHPLGTISKYLTGAHFVYAFERDSLYADERITDWMRRSKVGVIRWPGGTAVQNYHWDNLNGIAFKQDSWSPDYQAASADPKEYMDLDEYIAFCRRAGAEPMVGINIKSGKKYKREAESIEEARRLITYCREKEYAVRFWYIGNECFKGFQPREYARYIDRYAEVLRSVDPNIVIIGDWKFAPESKNRLAQSIEVAATSKQLDVLDIHEKWGNDWSLSKGGSISDWQNECPLYHGKFGDCIRTFYRAMKSAGRPNVKLAFNEWGVGKLTDGNEFDQALVAADYLIEVFRNDVYQACCWNLNMGPAETRILVTTDSKRRLLKLNPIAHVFEMVAHAMGNELLETESSAKSVYGFAALGQEGDLQVYLINKGNEAASVQFIIENAGFDATKAHAESFVSPGIRVSHEMAEGADGRSLPTDLPPLSFNRIRFSAR
ncbi:MAG: hypothetical protein PHP44_00220 [Kiritimatiellae bacterium]|nr:hypothetical protein [Kiritimatiellia bacterium]